MREHGKVRTWTLLLWCVACVPMFAAQPPDELPETEEAPAWQQRLLTERRVPAELAELSAAIDRMDTQAFEQQLELLRGLDGSLMVPVLNEGYQPLSAALFSRLQNLDAALRRIVNTADAVAASELQRVLQSGSTTELPTLLHQYSGTTTSQRIHLLLAVLHADRGQQLAAQHWLRPLQSPATAAEIRKLADQLLQRLSESPSAAAAPQTQPASAAAAPADETAVVPRFLRWLELLPVSVSARRVHQDTLQRFTDARSGGERGIPWMAADPALDAERVFVRQQDRVTAWDRSTGQYLWSRSLNPRKAGAADGATQRSVQRSGSGGIVERHEFLGRVTSDRDRLYVVYGVNDAASLRSAEESLQLRMLMNRGNTTSSTELWELIGVEKSTGRRLWTAGGERVEDRFRNELSQAWFFGPPIVAEGRLYQVFERDGLISVGCLEASSGQLLWSTPLLTPEFSIQQDARRQLLSARGLVHKGVLIASTTAGWVFAIDLLTHSILWAQQLPLVQEGQMRIPRGMGRGLNVMSAQPLVGPRVLRSQDPLLSGQSLFWMLAEAPAPVQLDAISGRIETLSSMDGTVCLHHGDGLIVMASALKTSAYRWPQLQPLWQQNRAAEAPLPVGPGALVSGQLLVPLSDGSISVLNLQDGRETERLQGLRAGRTAGGLYGDSAGIVSFGLDHISRLGTERGEFGGPEDWFQRAKFLLETGQPAAALQVLQSAAAGVVPDERVQHLKFRATLAIYAANPQQQQPLLEQLHSLAAPGSEQAIAQYLSLQSITVGQVDAVERLTTALQLSDSLLQQELPALQTLLTAAQSSEDNLLNGRTAGGLSSWRAPLRAWICQKLNELLNSGSPEQQQQIQERLAGYPEPVLLRLTGVAVADESLRRVEQRMANGGLDEINLQLLMHALTCAPAAVSVAGSGGNETEPLQPRQQRVLELIERLQEPARGLPAGGRQRLTLQLLAWIRQQAGGPALSELTAAVVQEREQHWREVAEGNWKLLPVSTTGAMTLRTSSNSTLRRHGVDDPVLQGIEWSLRRESDEILAENAHIPGGAAWRIRPRSSELRQALTLTEESISRTGTVLIHRSREAISAFSIVDQRLLWSRNMTGDAEMLLVMDRTFDKFNFDQNWQLLYERSRQICGQNSRWICLLGESRLEMLDLLTGEVLWSLSNVGLSRQIYAADQAVLLKDPSNGREVLLEPLTGQVKRRLSGQSAAADGQLRLPFRVRAAALTGKIIRAAGNQLVVWDPESSLDERSSLQWLDAVTLDVQRTVDLTGMIRAQFLGRELLAVLRQSQQVQLINLETGAEQLLSYEGADDRDLNLQRVEMAVDAGNLYVFEVPARQNGLLQPQMMLSLRGDPVKGDLLAISRSTGRLAWKFRVPDETLISFDGSENSALLLVSMKSLQLGANANNNVPGMMVFQGGTQLLITGLARSNGRQLLSYTVVSQFPTPGLRFSRPTVDRFELEAFGNRARLLRQPANVSQAP